MIAIGTRLGAYQITSLLGQGGMGEVYRATDTKLNRDVALKLLPEQFASDRDRKERFQREAHVLASLSHSNIAAIYGFEDSHTSPALVMELVEGPTLAERIAVGPLSIDEVLSHAKQIAEALEYAHERGVIHRDLKPANIKLTGDGKVKILDFGLAKAISDDRLSTTLSNSPTLSLAATQAGIILGTAAYMSPEQAKGKPVDRRADIWAFGVVVYEMLTGRTMFSGETASETMAQVIMTDPDWDALPASTPPGLRELLHRCLIKEPRMRLRDIGDARIAIEETSATPPGETSPATSAGSPRSFAAWSLRALPWLLAVGLAAVALAHFREKPIPPAEQLRFSILPPEKLTFANPGIPRVSPDGRYVLFNVSGERGTRLWIRALDTMESRPLNGTEGSTGTPFWSPDSRSIVFSVPGRLKKIEIAGGPPQTVCEIRADVFGGFWTRDNKIVFGGPPGLLMVPAAGGTPTALTIPDRNRGEQGHVEPTLLPDGVHFVYTRFAPGTETGGVYIGSLDVKPEEQGLRRLLPELTVSAYVPRIGESPANGLLLFTRDATLLAQPFDSSRLVLSGEAAPIAEQLARTMATVATFSVSANGVLVYPSGMTDNRRLTWYDRQGKEIGSVGPPGSYNELALSPDAHRVAVVRELDNIDIYVFDVDGNRSIRLTATPSVDRQPVWSPDGKRILYLTSPTGLFARASDGAGDPEQLLKFDQMRSVKDWSSDARIVIFVANNLKTKRDLWLLTMSDEKKPTNFLHTEFNENDAKFSPEAQGPHYVAYVSDESSNGDVYVTTFPDPKNGKWPISTGGGYQPRWRRDGKELLYFTGDGKLMSVEVTLSPSFKASTPKLLFQAPIFGGGATLNEHRWDLTPDGQRFLINTSSIGVSSPIAVVVNWQAMLKR